MKPRPTRYAGVRYHGDVLYYRYVNEKGQRVEVKFGEGSPKEASIARAEAIVKVGKIKRGELDPVAQEIAKQGRRPIAEHLADYLTYLRAKGNDQKHIRSVESYCNGWIAAGGVMSLEQARPETLLTYIAGHPQWSPRTANYARQSVLGLMRWAETSNRIQRSPMRGVAVPQRRTAAPRRPRRAFTAEEFGRLMDSLAERGARVGKARPDAPGAGAARERRMFYMLVASTGLRWTEASRLTWGDVSLGDGGGVITVQSHQSKTGTRAELPLVPAVAEALAEFKATQHTRLLLRGAGGGRVFAAMPQRATWLADLRRAGVVVEDERGAIASRGSLRKSFATWLYKAGVDLRDAQRLMRHSDPKLTAVVYTDIRLADLGRAVDGAMAATLGAGGAASGAASPPPVPRKLAAG